MSDQTFADEPKKSPSKPESYDEKVTVRKWDGKKFLNPVKEVPMFRSEISGQKVFYTMPPAMNAKTPKGSEITDKDGVVYVVDKVTEGSIYDINYVSPKPKDK